MPWLVRHAAHILTKYKIKSNGRTAFQLMKGRRGNSKMLPFGETVLFKIPKTQHKVGDFEDRWERGTWLGFMMRSGEHLVGTSKGVFRCSHLMRRPADKRWSKEMLADIGGSPAMPVPGGSGRRIPAFAKKHEDKSEDKSVFVPTREEQPEVRAAYIYKSDVEEHGPTPKCPGCRALIGGKYRAKHTDECRKRFQEILEQSEEGRRRFQSATERRLDAITREAQELEEAMKQKEGRARLVKLEAKWRRKSRKQKRRRMEIKIKKWSRLNPIKRRNPL